MAHQQLYDRIWAELGKLGYDDVIPYIIFKDVCEEVGADPEEIMDDFSERFNVDIG